jgi:two-component system, response regulator PdtaR
MKKLKALLAEDEALIAAHLNDTLGDAGFDVLGPYATVADAQECMLRETPDVAILDMLLRDGSALTLIENPRLRHIPLVIVSGSSAPETLRRCEGLIWLSKPVAPDDLLDAVDDAMRARRPGHQAHATVL